LLDETATEICVNDAALGPLNRFYHAGIGNALTPGKLRQSLHLE